MTYSSFTMQIFGTCRRYFSNLIYGIIHATLHNSLHKIFTNKCTGFHAFFFSTLLCDYDLFTHIFIYSTFYLFFYLFMYILLSFLKQLSKNCKHHPITKLSLMTRLPNGNYLLSHPQTGCSPPKLAFNMCAVRGNMQHRSQVHPPCV